MINGSMLLSFIKFYPFLAIVNMLKKSRNAQFHLCTIDLLWIVPQSIFEPFFFLFSLIEFEFYRDWFSNKSIGQFKRFKQSPFWKFITITCLIQLVKSTFTITNTSKILYHEKSDAKLLKGIGFKWFYGTIFIFGFLLIKWHAPI